MVELDQVIRQTVLGLSGRISDHYQLASRVSKPRYVPPQAMRDILKLRERLNGFLRGYRDRLVIQDQARADQWLQSCWSACQKVLRWANAYLTKQQLELRK